jgi:hypothetical protein
MFTNAMKVADKYGIKLADENHIDYNDDEEAAVAKCVAELKRIAQSLD